jgi:cysteinyl-tRNA synthetase
MNHSDSGNVAQKSEKEVSSEADIIDNHDDQDGIEDFDNDGEIESVLDADFQMGQQLMLIIKLLSESNERLKAENETLKSDVQRIRSGLAVLINSKQDLLSTKSNDAIDNEPENTALSVTNRSNVIDSETDSTIKNRLP